MNYTDTLVVDAYYFDNSNPFNEGPIEYYEKHRKIFIEDPNSEELLVREKRICENITYSITRLLNGRPDYRTDSIKDILCWISYQVPNALGYELWEGTFYSKLKAVETEEELSVLSRKIFSIINKKGYNFENFVEKETGYQNCINYVVAQLVPKFNRLAKSWEDRLSIETVYKQGFSKFFNDGAVSGVRELCEVSVFAKKILEKFIKYADDAGNKINMTELIKYLVLNVRDHGEFDLRISEYDLYVSSSGMYFGWTICQDEDNPYNYTGEYEVFFTENLTEMSLEDYSSKCETLYLKDWEERVFKKYHLEECEEEQENENE